jgi:hypothetical protein
MNRLAALVSSSGWLRFSGQGSGGWNGLEMFTFTLFMR